MKQLEQQVALITGAGRGLGRAIAQTFAEEGAVVILADVREETAFQAAAELTEAGYEAYGLYLDVNDEHRVNAAVRDILSRHQRLDILVNNAGTDVTLSVEELSVSDWDRVIGTNLRGPFLLSKEVFPIMTEQGGGAILTIASTASKRTWANATAYHAGKWGVLGLSHALHVEGRKRNIKVTALVSGGLRTPFILERFPDTDPGVLQDPKNVARAALFAVTQPAESVIPEMMVLPMRETSWP